MNPVATPRPTILLIAENATDVAPITSALEQYDCRLLTAWDGETGLQQAGEAFPDLILIDAGKPSGFDLCRRLKAQAATRDIPVILITGGLGKSDRHAAFAAGGADYLARPFLPEELAARIAPFIELNAAQQQPNAGSADAEQRIARHTAVLNGSVELLRLKGFALNHVREAAYLIDPRHPNGRFLYVNAEACRALGYSAQELLGMGVTDIDPDFTDEIARRQRSELARTGTMLIESRHRRKDGSLFPVEIVASRFEYHGEPYNLALVRDISERKRAEQTLSRSERQYRTLVENTPDLIVRYDNELQRIYVNPAWEAASGLPAQDVVGIPAADIPNVPRPLVPEYGTALQRALATGAHQTVEFDWVNAYGAALHLQYLVVPERDDKGNVVSLLAVGRDITESKRTQRDLLLLNHALNESTEAAYLMNDQGRFVYVNDAACQSLGYRRDELLTMGPPDIDADILRETFQVMLRDVLTKGPTRGIIESRQRARDGRIFPVEIATSVVDYGGARFILTLARDISERKEAERRLHTSEQAFRALVENSPDFVARYDRDCRRTYVNPAAIAITGCAAAEQLLGATPLKGTVMTDAQGFVDQIRHVFATGEALAVETPYRDSHGNARWGDSRIVPEFGPDGHVVSVLAISRDITGLKESEQRFRTLAENSPDNIIRHDRAGRIVYVNPRMLKTWGLETAEGVLGKTLVEAFGHADSRRYHPIHMQVMERGAAESYDYMVPDIGSGVRYHTILVVPERNEAGEVVGALAIGRNITERKRAERQLALLTCAVNQSHDAFYLVDSELRLRYVNDAAVRALGYSREELLAMDVTAVDPGIGLGQLRELMRQTAAAGVFPGVIETRHRAKDGSTIPVEIGASAVVHDGETVFLTVARDVSERKRMEVELRRQADFQQRLLDGFNDVGLQLVILENGRAIYYSNRKLAREFGLSDAEIDAHPVMLDYIAPDDRARVADLHRRRLAGEAVPSTYELGMMVPGGVRRDYEVAVAVIPETDPVRMIAIIKDITERKKTERALHESYGMLQDLAARRDSAREEEKTRIAREIHDELGQQLTALRMGIAAIGFEFGQREPMLVERVRQLCGLADQTIKEVRNIAAALRPAALDGGIGAALEWLVAEFQRHAGIVCSLRLATPAPELDDYRAIALFRIVQESLTNVARHAKARNATISLASGDNVCELEIRDDGCGFDPTAARRVSFGLTGMRERALMLRGDIEIHSSPGAGTAIKLTVPLGGRKDAT